MAKYNLTISRNTIDKLGVKLYDKASDVVSELISNSYDADAKKVTINIPLNVYLATKGNKQIKSKNFQIVIEDDGHGFDAKQANNFYLKVGSDRRKDPNRGKFGAKSPEHKRPVMGRKGIGKLAAFGICKTIEVRSASGFKGKGPYEISHFIMNYEDITKDTDTVYSPKIGKDDGTLSNTRGTKITLTDFLYKKIPDKDTFMRQLARKFGIGSTDFKVEVIDSVTNESEFISGLHLELLEDTKISVNKRSIPFGTKTLPVKGWIAYSKHSYKNEEMAGVRIYARRKLAATTRDFGHTTGFTGEFTVRTYLVGEIHVDWLDADKGDDLIASDRQDILWSSEEGQALEEWGKKLIEELGKKSLGPIRKKSFDLFKEKSRLEYHAKQRFGSTPVYDAALEVGKTLAASSSVQSLKNDLYVKSLLELILSVAPHKMIVDKLKQIADEGNSDALELMSALFGDTRLAETASLGQIALERIRAIETLETAVRKNPETRELEMQEILENAPWLIEPQWTVLQSNETFSHFQSAFESWYKKQTGQKIITTVSSKYKNKRPDFIMIHAGRAIEIVEIKKPEHDFNVKDYERLDRYIEKMEEFRKKNKQISNLFPRFHVTLICDDVNIKGPLKRSFDSLINDNILEQKTWEDLLTDTKRAHKDFLKSRNKLLKDSAH